MRLRLVHKLSLLLIGAVLVSVVSMASVLAFNLSEGFTDYLAARDQEWLEHFAGFTEGFIEAQTDSGNLNWQAGGMKELMDAYAQKLGLVNALPKPPEKRPKEIRSHSSPGAPAGAREAAPDPAQHGVKNPRRPHPDNISLRGRKGKPHQVDDFVFRLVIVDAVGRQLFSNRTRLGEAADFIEEPVSVDGDVVAHVRLYAASRVPDNVETRFLRQQYTGIALVSFVLLVLALLSSWFMARHWVRPLYSIQEATSRLAQGNFDVRVPVAGLGRSRNDEVGDLIGDINRMAEGLGRLERSRRRWLADISHELRTPLAVLRGEIEALIDGVRPITMPSIVSLREEALRLGSLVDDLHLLALSDLKALPCEFAELDAVDVLNDLVNRFESRSNASNLTLSFENRGPNSNLNSGLNSNLNSNSHSNLNSGPPHDSHDSSKSIPVCWDRFRIHQLLDNLLENSLRYTDAPGRIVISIKQNDQSICITINDTAPAPSTASLPHLFEPLYRTEDAGTYSRQGSGLGLAISDAIARSHDGKLEASLSALGGLQVSVTLPQAVRGNDRGRISEKDTEKDRVNHEVF